MSNHSRSDWKSALSVSNIVSALCMICAFFVVAPRPAAAQVQAFPNTPDVRITSHTLRKKTAPDECFAFLASPSPLPKFSDPLNCAIYGTNPLAKPKVNQSYIWGLTHSGDNVWFGTFANANCITQAGSSPDAAPPYQTESWVCEFQDSPYYPSPYPNGLIGDARPPRAYQYSKSTHGLVDKTPRYPVYVTPNNVEGIVPQLYATRGIRSATAHNGVILMAGPHLDPKSGLFFFAWDEVTGAYLGARPALGYNNIRQFLNLDGILYTAVGTNACSGNPPVCTPNVTGGRILRLNPSKIAGCTFVPPPSPTTPAPACFLLNGGTAAAPTPLTEVGTLNTTAGSLAAHNGRIYTVTWPSQDLPGILSSLYMSPVVPAGGLTNAHNAAGQWTQVWKSSDYEPDAFIAQTYAGGAIASFDGYLFWGTLHIPMQAFQYIINAYPPATQEQALQDLSGAMRSTVFFRGKDFDTANPQIDLLYGNASLPVFTPPSGATPQTWTIVPNKMGKKSLWGSSGFGNIWNTYTWSATVWDNRLWVGTMDWSFTSQQGIGAISPSGIAFPEMFTNDRNVSRLPLPGSLAFPPEAYANATFGADLFYFTSASKPAFPESTNGVENPTTFGVRNELVSGGNLFLGMANAMNLLTDPADPKKFGGLGGWELDELAKLPNLNTPVGTNVTVRLPNGVSITYCSVTSDGTTFSSIVKNPFDRVLRVNPLLAGFDLDGPQVPSGIARSPANVVLLWSSAVWGQGCSTPSLAKVKVPIPPAVTAPGLLQMQWDGSQLVWQDITTFVDLTSGTIEGDITSSYLGVLGVAPVAAPKLTGGITAKGTDPANGSYFLDLQLTNTGTGNAEVVSLNELTFQTLIGKGTVSYNTTLSPPLPRSIGTIAPGANTVVRLYLQSTARFGGASGVRAFSIVEAISMKDPRGAYITVSLSQSVVPAFQEEVIVPLPVIEPKPVVRLPVVEPRRTAPDRERR